MKYIDTAFTQLAFAWKLYNYALEGRINLDELDRPVMFQEGKMVLVLPEKIFNGPDDLILAFENNLSIAFGAAAITLNRCREEAGVKLVNSIQTEIDNFSSVLYQIRNAFAHDISEPRWNIKNPIYARIYEFGSIRIDLSQVRTKIFEYEDIGGPDVLFWMRDFGDAYVWHLSTVGANERKYEP